MPVFLSYQFRERPIADELYGRLDIANAPLDVYDQRVRTQAGSPEAGPLKAGLGRQVRAAEAFVCIMGPTTATSSWVDWEITRAHSEGKRILVLRGNDADPLPPPLDDIEFEPVPDIETLIISVALGRGAPMP